MLYSIVQQIFQIYIYTHRNTYLNMFIICHIVWIYCFTVGCHNVLKICHYELWIMLGFLASRREEFYLGPVTWLDCSELLCKKALLEYKRDRESFWHKHQKGTERLPPCSPLALYLSASCQLEKRNLSKLSGTSPLTHSMHCMR